MISDLAPKSHIPLISGFGVAGRYIRDITWFSVYPFVGDDGYHIAFLLTGALFFLFALPLFFFSKDKKVIQKPDHASFFFYQVIKTSLLPLKK